MPRAFNRARLVRIISTSAVAGLASIGVFAVTASADVNSIRIENYPAVDVNSVNDLGGVRVNTDDSGTDAPDTGGVDVYRIRFVNSV